MKSKYIFIAVLLIGKSFFNYSIPKMQGDVITKDTLTYTYKILKQRANDCNNKPDSNCSSVNIKYPVFYRQPALNDSISSIITKKIFLINDKSAKSPKTLMTGFIKYYDNHKKKNPGVYVLDLNAVIIRQDSSLTTLAFNGYVFDGGNHGLYQKIFFNWNPKKASKISLKDVLIPHYEAALTKVAEGIFRKNEKLTSKASLEDNYFFEDGKFSLNNNFLFTKKGVIFLYNEYQIKPFSEGITKIFIPYSKIKSLLRPNTVLAQYIK